MYNKAVTTEKKEAPMGFNVFRKPFFAKKKEEKTQTRNVIRYGEVSKSDSEAIGKFFDVLVPDKKFPIDEKLIWEEGLPVFEAFLGEKKFRILKKYFGIGYPKAFGIMTEEREVNIILAELRTMENAMHYLHGYKDLIERMAAKLYGAPEEMGLMERAKIVRMYTVLFCGYNYFVEDYEMIQTQEGKRLIIRFDKALKNNPKPFYPEEFFDHEKLKFEGEKGGTILYDRIMHEFNKLDKKLKKSILRFAELKKENDTFVSVNDAPAAQTFSSVRSLKGEIHEEPGIIPFEMVAFKEVMERIYFGDFYTMYKVLTHYKVEELNKKLQTLEFLNGAVKDSKPYYCVEIVEGALIGGPNEAKRIVEVVEYAADNGFEFLQDEKEKNENQEEVVVTKKYNVALYLGAIKFATDMGYIQYSNSVSRDIEVAKILILRGSVELFDNYRRGNVSKEDMIRELRIDDAFERDELGIIKDPSQIVIRFAIENGYVSSEADINVELIKNVFVSGNEEYIKKYYRDEIKEEVFRKKIGFEEEFAEMYFDLKKVDASALETKLLGMKKSFSSSSTMSKSALVIKLYCYLVENEVKCGPKNKIIKRNKSLKPQILMNLVTEAK